MCSHLRSTFTHPLFSEKAFLKAFLKPEILLQQWVMKERDLNAIPDSLGPPRWLSGKEFACQCRRFGFSPWIRKIPWRRKWQPTLIFLPGKFQGQRSLVGYSPRGCKELDTIERLHFHFHFHIMKCEGIEKELKWHSFVSFLSSLI